MANPSELITFTDADDAPLVLHADDMDQCQSSLSFTDCQGQGQFSTNDGERGKETDASTSGRWSPTRNILERTGLAFPSYPRFPKKTDYVSMRLKDRSADTTAGTFSNTPSSILNFNYSQATTISAQAPTDHDQAISIPAPAQTSTAEHEAAVSCFSACLKAACIAFTIAYFVCAAVIVYLNFALSVPASTVSTIGSLLGSVFIGIAFRVTKESVEARHKRFVDDSNCYAALAITLNLIAIGIASTIIALRYAVISGTKNYSLNALFG